MMKIQYIVILLACSLFLGCDETVQAIKPDGKPYTLFGFLNPRADTQAIRVFPIDEVLELETRNQIDGELSTTNQSTGNSLTWLDSLVTFDPINNGHVFHKAFSPEYDTPYVITITRSDGARSQVVTHVPPDTRAALSVVKDTGTDIEAQVDWEGAPRVQASRVKYNLLFEIDGERIENFYELEKNAQRVNSSSNWILSIPFDDDARQIFRELNRPQGSRLSLCELVISALVTNEDWNPPNGDYDPNILVQPGTFTNVENGFGFVGAGYLDEITWTPDSTQIRGAGFHYNPNCYRN